ncbi:uncharacterized protein BXZ73DRAFT_107926 [Epithele typhae]|uniref:uncharacterized protein n=1 Tax=Epithele typhae TaxID=378194 RepID=UPI002007A3CA|nr:uncharacterized protein BXZ73DRAFT_107926 [Epithele typhae]KAH9911542.1 hypothetical protein BXZ73DRAFT_107926 [Epithele typhae]
MPGMTSIHDGSQLHLQEGFSTQVGPQVPYYGDEDADGDVPDDQPSPAHPHPEVPSGFGIPTYYGERTLSVLHTNGQHRLSFTFCQCEGAEEEALQLWRLGFYPGSVKRVHTVYTEACLKDFALSNLQCKTSAFAYHTYLCRKTDGAFYRDLPNGYKGLLRASRQWQDMARRIHAGYAHSSDEPGLGELALRCPTCPRTGENTPDGWERDPKRHKYPQGIAMDGTYAAPHLRMKNEEDDVNLSEGLAYTVADEPYKMHLERSMSAGEERLRSTCHEHRAALEAHNTKAHLDATGVGAIAVARMARQLKDRGTEKEKKDLALDRQQLLADIRKFNQAGVKHLPKEAYPVLDGLDGADSLGEEWDELDATGLVDGVPLLPSLSVEFAGAPETRPIILPSTLGPGYLSRHKLWHLAKMERELRMADMNDCLNGIRDGISAKSYLFHTGVRHVSSTRTSLRSFDEIRLVDHTVTRHVRVYMQSWNALPSLYDIRNGEELSLQTQHQNLYKRIHPGDLKLNASILEPSLRGTRDQHPSWVWTFSGPNGPEDAELFHTETRRSMWYRSSERKDRWSEELDWLLLEMGTTVRSFRRSSAKWEALGMQAGQSPGHSAYAFGQASMWSRFAVEAENAFEGVVQRFPPPISQTQRIVL